MKTWKGMCALMMMLTGCAMEDWDDPVDTHCPQLTAREAADTSPLVGHWEGVEDERDVLFVFSPSGAYRLLTFRAERRGVTLLERGTWTLSGDRLTLSNVHGDWTERVELSTTTLSLGTDNAPSYRRVLCSPETLRER